MTHSAEKVGTAVFGVCLAALGLFICIQTAGMDAGPAYAAVGPRAFPAMIGLGLVLSGGIQLWGASKHKASGEEHAQYDWQAVLGVAGVFAVQIFLLPWLGWIPTAVFLFMGVSRAFGTRTHGRSLLIGVILATVTFLTFNFLLGLNLPMGALFQWLAPN